MIDRINRALMRGFLRYAQATLRWDQRIEPTATRARYLEEIEEAMRELEEVEE